MRGDINVTKDTFFAVSQRIFEQRTRGISRAEIAGSCGLSAMTVGKVASFLLKEGLASEVRSEHSKGRHANLLIPSETLSYVTVFACSDTSTLAICDYLGDLARYESVPISIESFIDLDTYLVNIKRHVFAKASTDIPLTYTAVVCEDAAPCASIASDKKIRSCELVFSRRELVGSAIKRDLRRYNTVYLGLSRSTCTVLVYEKSLCRASDSFSLSPLDFYSKIETASKRLTDLLNTTELSKSSQKTVFVFESELLPTHCSRKLFETVAEVSARNGLPFKKKIYAENMSFTNREALRRLKAQTSRTVTEYLFST